MSGSEMEHLIFTRARATDYSESLIDLSQLSIPVRETQIAPEALERL
jgi:hypothetical protein